MWFGSWNGIHRFDGHSFISYKSYPGDRSQLGNDRIDQIAEDDAGYLWVEAYDMQIYRFDKKTEQFLPLSSIINIGSKQKISFTKILIVDHDKLWLHSERQGIYCVYPNDPSKTPIKFKKGESTDYALPSDSINFFHKDLDNLIWVGTPDGLCCLAPTASGTYKNYTIPKHFSSGVNVTDLDEDADNLYFSTGNGNLIIYNKKAKKFSVRKIADGRLNALRRSDRSNNIYATTNHGELIAVDLETQKITVTNYSTGESLHSFYEDRKGNLWIEPEKTGCIRFQLATRSFNYFYQKIEEKFNSNGNRFRVLEDNNNTVWINLKGGGFCHYNEVTRSIDNTVQTPDGSTVKLPNIVYAIHHDPSGILWLTTNESQLVKIILQGNDFRQQLLFEQGSLRSDNEVRGIYYDNKNRLWLGVKSGNLDVYQNDKEITGLFDNQSQKEIGLVYSILQDSRGNIWLGTKSNGLYKAKPINKEETKYHLSHFMPDKNRKHGLIGNQFYSILEDRQGRIWLGTFDEGLVLVSEDGDSVKFSHTGNAFANYPKSGFLKVRHMALDEAGNIWIGTTNGLLIVNINDRHSPEYKYISYGKISGDKESLGNNDIQFIYRDSKNRMWLATSGGGLSLAIGSQPFQSLKFRNYTTRDGMPNDYVLSCAEDKQGKLWIATENGLSKFDPEHGSFRNYDSYDGLQRSSFSEAAVCQRLPDGRLIFGTTKGFLSFDPGHINRNRINANIAFTNLQINNEDAGPGMNENVLKTDINYVNELTLKHNQNIISIDYAILDYRAGNRQAFVYRLLGFDSTWRDDRQQRRATYTNLPPGHYVFEVKNLSPDLYSQTPYRQLSITILPPFWKTWWAFTIYVILIAAILLIVRRVALAMIRLRHKIAVEQKLAELKLNFFTNVSHELRTPLTLIVNPLEQLSRKEKLSADGTAYVDVARKNANRMVRFINQLLDIRKVQSNKASLRISRVEIISFIKKISEHFAEAARSKGIKLDILSEEKELNAWIDAEKLDVVIYNLLGNALKFTPQGKAIKVLIKSDPKENSFSIDVTDQGPGVKKELLEDIFELFHEGGQSSHTDMKGTGIGLALSREFVNLHGGTISAANNEDGGLTVTVKLKLSDAHYKKDEVSYVDHGSSPVAEEATIQKQLLQPLHNGISEKELAPLVLLVEDNDELRGFLKRQLSEFYRVETASNGLDGWQKADALIPDLILSDIMMPVMDGIQMLDKVRNDINTSHIPVVLLSAKYSIESQIEGLKYGADHYITKPFNNEFLVASIDNLLRQRKKIFESLVEKKKAIDISPAPIIITSKDETFLKDVIRTVEEKMADPDFNIETVAETMAMSRTTFYKKFKSLTSLTPVEFVRDIRLQHAKQYLDAGGNNISEVAYLVGFSNPKYFSTCFKEKFNLSPSDYQKSKVI
jgi:signal transduction histidine kinase/ligand-binding sensor domain-containing protein/DNA-binding response OmpR family regulator